MKKRSAMAVAGAVVLSLLAGIVSHQATQTSKAGSPVIVQVAPAGVQAPVSSGEVRDD
jgi:uncharacterized membrane-anchored protein